MADKSQTGSAPTTRQIFIVALLLGVIAGCGGAALGFMLGGQVVSNEEETKAQANSPMHVSRTAAESASGMELSVSEHTKAQGEKSEHQSASSGASTGHDDSHSAATSKMKPSKLIVKELTPIVTNLAEPATNWIRLQSAIVYDSDEMPHPEKIVAELTSDITAYLRTVSLGHLEGVDGLRRLQDELSERATIRSNGKIHEFIVETMVVQ